MAVQHITSKEYHNVSIPFSSADRFHTVAVKHITRKEYHNVSIPFSSAHRFHTVAVRYITRTAYHNVYIPSSSADVHALNGRMYSGCGNGNLTKPKVVNDLQQRKTAVV
jgi:hypothetical protein